MTVDISPTGAVPAWDLADRLRKSLRSSELDSREMANYLGVSRTTISAWINGRAKPSAPAIKLWAMRCGVPVEWLITGADVRTRGSCLPLAVAA